MHQPTSDLRIRAQKPLIAPAVLEDELPLSDAGAELVRTSRRNIAAIISGSDDRLLVVIGPCSIHDPPAALEYAQRLRSARRGTRIGFPRLRAKGLPLSWAPRATNTPISCSAADRAGRISRRNTCTP